LELFDANDLGWEEYYWINKKLYGIHTRTRTKMEAGKPDKIRIDNIEDHLAQIYIAINSYREYEGIK